MRDTRRLSRKTSFPRISIPGVGVVAKRKTKAKKKSNTSNGRANGAEESLNRLDQVRDLLFGGDRQATDQRFRQIEQQLARELERQEARLEKAIQEVQETAQREIAKLGSQLLAEQTQRHEEEAAALKRLESAKATLTARMQRIDDEHKQRARTIRERLSTTTAKLREEFSDADTQMWNTLQEQLAQITAAGTDRVALSSLFGQLSKSLLEEE